MKRIIISLLIPVISLISLFCSLKKPTDVENTLIARFVVVDTSGTLSTDSLSNIAIVSNAQICINSIDYDIKLRYETNADGIFEMNDVLASCYRIFAYKQLSPEDIISPGKQAVSTLLIGSIEKNIQNQSTEQLMDSIKTGPMRISPIVINEIYYSCPANSGCYISDQYVELYNASNTTQYLDKLFICRISGTRNFGDNLVAIEYYRFPGSGTDYPIEPNQFIVIAQDAIDHVMVGGAKGSIDLSHADWEFYNQHVADIDNPNVPNLFNASPGKVGDDFMIHLTTNEVCLIKANDADPMRYFEEHGEVTNFRIFNISQVLDGVEYAAELDHDKAFDIHIDAGLAGYGITGYSGKSIERHHPVTGGPGFDSNNSTFDFVSLNHPTPGWQHSEADIFYPGNNLAFCPH